MKYIIFGLLITGLFSSCSSVTTLTASWISNEYQAKKFKKLAVVVMSPIPSNRVILEIAIAEKINAEGTKAIGTLGVFPLADKVGEIEKLNLDQETIQQKIRKKILDNEIDALLIISLLDKNKVEQYVQGASISIGAPVYNYNYTYYNYYSYAYTQVYSTGHYVSTSSYFIESNLYDIESENLIWTGQTKTVDPTSIEKESVNFANIIVADMLSKGALLKK